MDLISKCNPFTEKLTKRGDFIGGSSQNPLKIARCAPSSVFCLGALSAHGNQSQRLSGVFQATFLVRLSSNAKRAKWLEARLIEKAFLEHWLHRLVTLRYSFQLVGLYHTSDKITHTKTVIPAYRKGTAMK